MDDQLQKEIKQTLDEIELEKEQSTPYWVLENDYWKQPREVCVVDEINCLENEDAEVLCGLSPRNEQWIRRLAEAYGFTVEHEGEFKDSLGKFIKFIIKKQPKGKEKK